MDANFKVTNPTEIVFTMTATMPLAEWIKIRNDLDESKNLTFASAQFKQQIISMVNQATKTFYPLLEDTKDET